MDETIFPELCDADFYAKTNEIAALIKGVKTSPAVEGNRVERLTQRNLEVVAFMRAFLSENDRLPSMQDMASYFGWASENSSQTHIDKLVRLRVIERSGICKYRFVRSASARPATGNQVT